jgi:hypothetical protein
MRRYLGWEAAVIRVRSRQLTEVIFDVAVSGRKAEAAYRNATVKGSRPRFKPQGGVSPVGYYFMARDKA